MHDHTNNIAIDAVGVRHRYGLTTALDDLSLQVRCGEVLCIIGPNGAGKTTLLSVLGGMVLPQKGHVTVFGRDRWRENHSIRKESTFIFADPAFGSSLSPYEFLRLFAQIYGIPKPVFLERAHRLAEEMDMLPHWDKSWGSLSLGMQKKTALIAAFLPDAHLRMLDEPFAGGVDPNGMERLYAWMSDARERGETIIFSTQVLEQAENIADRILMLENGAIRILATPAELIEEAGIAPTEPRALYKAFLALTQEETA